MSWLDYTTSFYKSHLDKEGERITFRDILFTRFADCLPTIIQLKKLSRNDPGYESKKRLLKNALSCYALNLLEGRKEVLSYSGIMQLDIDNISEYDISELKSAIFNLPFICFCGISCSGNGLYAFVRIAEPNRLHEYAEHVFRVFHFYQIRVDTSKGRNVNDLRYVSYDCNMLYRENPEPLKIEKFYIKPKTIFNPTSRQLSSVKLIQWAVKEISNAQKGSRFETVRKVSYTLGGYGSGLDEIKVAVNNSPQYYGEEKKYLTHADEGFAAGQLKPLTHA